MLVNCAAYQNGKKLGDISPEEISEYLRRPEGFVWVALKDPGPGELASLQDEFDLHELAIEDAHHGHQRPKIETYGDSLFIVLETAQLVDDEVRFGETHLFVGPKYVVSVRHGPSLGYAHVRSRCESTPQLLIKGPGFVLYALMDFVVDHYFPIVEALEDELQAVEDQIFGESFSRETTRRIYELKRDLLEFKRAVSPLVDVCNRLMRFDLELIPEDTRPYFRDVYDHLIRVNDELDNDRELVAGTLEVYLSTINNNLSVIMKRLAQSPPLTLDDLVEQLPQLTWNQIFQAVDGLTRTGAIHARRTRFQYELSRVG